MKKSVILSVLAMAAASVFGDAADNLHVIFSTSGVDKYADGTAVKAGERYALVWKTGDAVSILADGSVVGGEMKIAFATKADGHCSPCLLDVPTPAGTGSWAVYLLDTRVYSSGGSFTYAPLNAKGVPTMIKGTAEAAANVNFGSVSAKAAQTSLAALPEGASEAKIDAIELVGDNVQITISGASPYAQYDVNKGSDPAKLDASADKPTAGATDGVITIVTPKTGDKGFFSVIRK